MSYRLSDNLTMQENSFPVLGPGGKLLGIVIRNAETRLFVGWTDKRLGDFPTMSEAIAAVRNAARAKKAKAGR